MKFPVLLAFLLPVVLGAQVVPGEYIVELSGTPAARLVTRQRAHARLAANDPQFASQRALVRAAQQTPRLAIQQAGGQILASVNTVANALIVSIPDAQAGLLQSIPGVVRVDPVHIERPVLDHALPLHHVPAAWATLPTGEDGAGRGIKIGMIDTGIDVNHPGFQDSSLAAVSGFPKTLSAGDVKYTNSKIIVAKNYTTDASADDTDGHGTGTSMAAAGETCDSPWGPITGVAPKAYLGNYKVISGSGTTTDALILEAFDDAVADGMDVINMSIGGPVLTTSQTQASSVFNSAIQTAVAAGVVVTVSAGNQGPDPGSIADLGTAPEAITVGALQNDRTLAYSVTVTGASPYMAQAGSGPNPGKTISGRLFDVAAIGLARGLRPNARAGKGSRPTAPAPANGEACSALPPGSLSGDVALIERGDCTFEIKIDNVAAAGAVGALVYDNVPSDAGLAMSVGAATLPAMSVTYANGVDLKSRAARTREIQASMDFSGATNFPNDPDLATYTSRGPSLGSALKPDLMAVGGDYDTGTFVTAAQNAYSSGESYSASGFIQTAGTSFSSPIVAGAAAFLKGARPGLSADQYRSLLINTATASNVDANTPASISQAGAGMLDLLAAVQNDVTALPTSLDFGTWSGAINTSLNLTLTNIGASAETYSITVVPAGTSPAPAVSASTVPVAAASSDTVSVQLSASGLEPGEYSGYLRITGTKTQVATKVPYWFGVPGGDPAHAPVLYQPYTDSTGFHRDEFVFRLVDAAGLPYQGTIKPTVTSDQSQGVSSVYATGNFPGTYAVDVRLASGLNTFTITAGSVTQTVVISAD
jgi:minor extracellular serine protease Vpr